MWYVEELFLDRENIRAKGDIDSDEFTDLLVVETALKKLIETGVLSLKDLHRFRDFLNSGKKEYDILHKIAKSVSSYLGGKYTDEGYLDFMRERYKLNDDQIETLNAYMKSNMQHRLLTKPFKKENVNVKKATR